MENQKIVTPVGKLQWVFIDGQGKTNLNGEQIYTVDVRISLEDHQDFIDSIDNFYEDNKPKGAKKAKSLGYKFDEETNEAIITLKTKTTFPSGDPKKIKVVDGKLRPVELEEGVKIGNGSEGRASGMMAVYKAGQATGVTFYLDGLQLTKLVKYEGGGSDFDELDGDNFLEEDFDLVEV